MPKHKAISLDVCGGCAAKMSLSALRETLSTLPQNSDKHLLVGFDTSDDAAVYRLNETQALIHTTDFFPPMVSDPYVFGQIAATNALSDVFAMGGRVQTALNLVAFPESADTGILREVLRGGAEKVMEAGGVLGGGHTIFDPVLKYGLAVTGIVHPERIWRNNTGQAGDQLILTKPLGVSIVTSGFYNGAASEESFRTAVDSMTQLNKMAAEIGQKYRIHACTDVTGFGFLGHLLEMLSNKHTVQIHTAQIPYIKEAYPLAEQGFVTGGGGKNRAFVTKKVGEIPLPAPMQEILFDPQTSGGLLMAAHPEDAPQLLEKLQAHYPHAAIVGTLMDKNDEGAIFFD